MAMRSAQDQRQEVRWLVSEFFQIPFSKFGLAVNRSSNYIGVIINGNVAVPTRFVDHMETTLDLDMGFIFFADRPRPAAHLATAIKKRLGLSSAKRHHLTKSSPVTKQNEAVVTWELKNGTTIEIAGPPDILEPVKNAIRDGLLRITLSYRENLSL